MTLWKRRVMEKVRYGKVALWKSCFMEKVALLKNRRSPDAIRYASGQHWARGKRRSVGSATWGSVPT